MNVEISGALLASLYFEHGLSYNDLEGFLLGKITSRCTDTISDTQINGIKEETTCSIYGYITCTKPFSWYNNTGATDVDKLRSLLPADKAREVVGWYKFRRNSTLMVSLREMSIHHHLLDCFPGILSKNFLFLLCTTQQSVNKSTHTMDHVFQVYNGSCFRALSVSVINLGDSVTQYKVQGTSSFDCKDGRFAGVIGKYSKEFFNNHHQIQSVLTIHNMNTALNEQLQDLCTSVSMSEHELEELRQSVRRLKDQLSPPKQHAAKHDTNPFKSATPSCQKTFTQSTTGMMSSTNPFYSGAFSMQTASTTATSVTSASTDYDAPPPYSEIDNLVTDQPSVYDFVPVKQHSPDVDLILLSDEESQTEQRQELLTDQPSSFTNDPFERPASLIDCSIPQISKNDLAGWNITGLTDILPMKASDLDFFVDVRPPSVVGQNSDLSEILANQAVCPAEGKQMPDGTLDALCPDKEMQTKQAKTVREAIELSSDEEPSHN